MRERLKIDMSPVKIRVESEPYVTFLGKSYVPVVDVLDVKRNIEGFLIVSAKSISEPFYQYSQIEGGLKHAELWINKKSDDRMAKYEITWC